MFVNLNAAKGKGGFGSMVYHINGKLSYLKPREKIILPPY
jgi:hypothetical protein